MSDDAPFQLVATCGKGLEDLLADELLGIGAGGVHVGVGAVRFVGDAVTCMRANWRLRLANRVLIELGGWAAPNRDKLQHGAFRLVDKLTGSLFHPDRSFSIQASCSGSRISDPRWASMVTKDGIVDAQRQLWGRRSEIERDRPTLPLRLRIHRDRATLLLDSSGDALDRRGYRLDSTKAALREPLAAAVVLAAGITPGQRILDPMCGSATLLIEAASIAHGLAPGRTRQGWAFQGFPGFARDDFDHIVAEPIPALSPTSRVSGWDISRSALAAASANVERAELEEHIRLRRTDATQAEAPASEGLLLLNPPYGHRLDRRNERLLPLLTGPFAGWTLATIVAGEAEEEISVLPTARCTRVYNGPLQATIRVIPPRRAT